ncbi:MAG TPA: hypothetical protein VFL80_00130, partial [Thermoanaerobaculia bacterium]|nr:hypothetical protein [Thermoanaerobaculia bacterium]
DTPPPDLVAASGADAPLRLRHVAALLAAGLTMLSFVVVLSRHATVYGRAAPMRPPAVLANQARQLAQQLSWQSAQADSGYWFELRKTDGQIDFHWRSSPKPMLSLSRDGRLRSNIPPLDTPGMTHVVLSPSGQLLALASLPPERIPSSPPVAWDAVLRAAGLETSDLKPWNSDRSPAVAHDETRAWRTLRGTVVRASRFRGRFTSFEIDSAHPGRQRGFSSSRLPHAVYLWLLIGTLLVGAWLARRNLRAGRVDRRGAARVALWVFVYRLLYGVLVAHHPLTLEEEASLLAALLGAALLLAAEVWLGYVALEPLVRRLDPRAMIAWTRVNQGRIRDSLVGRDILIGVIAGLSLRLLDHLRDVLPTVIPSLEAAPSVLAVETLGSVRMAFALLFHSQARSIFYGLFALFLLVFLQHLFQRKLAASLIWLTITTLAWSRWDDARVDLPLVALQMLILLIALRRAGLLASAVALFTHLVTLYVPLTHRWDDFYFGQSLVAVTVLLIVALYGTWAALGGQWPLRRAHTAQEPSL